MDIFGLLMDKFKEFLILINQMILKNLIKNIVLIIFHGLQQDYFNHQNSYNIRNINQSDTDQSAMLGFIALII